jgi:protein disulfide-isomerase A6
MKLFLSALATALLARAYASSVQVLDPDNFDSIIGIGKPALVELFVVFCELFRRLR